MPARLFLEMIDHSKPVRVFRNWKHDCYSIMQDGRLRASAKQVRLANVEFQVRESGRQRMLVENRRNVHAFAEQTQGPLASLDYDPSYSAAPSISIFDNNHRTEPRSLSFDSFGKLFLQAFMIVAGGPLIVLMLPVWGLFLIIHWLVPELDLQ